MPRAVRLTNGPYTLWKDSARPPAPTRPLLPRKRGTWLLFLRRFKKAPRAVPRKNGEASLGVASCRGAKWVPPIRAAQVATATRREQRRFRRTTRGRGVPHFLSDSSQETRATEISGGRSRQRHAGSVIKEVGSPAPRVSLPGGSRMKTNPRRQTPREDQLGRLRTSRAACERSHSRHPQPDVAASSAGCSAGVDSDPGCSPLDWSCARSFHTLLTVCGLAGMRGKQAPAACKTIQERLMNFDYVNSRIMSSQIAPKANE